MLKQLSVFVENEVGSLSKVTTILKENNINIRAIASFDTPDFGIMRIIVDKYEQARNILAEKNFIVKITDVLAVELEDKPGDLDKTLNIIAEAGLCVNYIYSFVLRNEKAPLMVMNIDDMVKGTEILKKAGVKVIE